MTIEEFNNLERGDIIVHKKDKGNSLIITSNYGDRKTAVRTIDISNPFEWDLVLKANYFNEENS